MFSITLHNHISEGNLKRRNLCVKTLILQIYSLTKLDNKIDFFLGIFVKVQKSLSLRPETEVQKVKISNKDQNWQSLTLSTLNCYPAAKHLFKNHDNQQHRHLMIIIIITIVNIFTPVMSQQNIFFKMPMKASLKSLLVIA